MPKIINGTPRCCNFTTLYGQATALTVMKKFITL